MYMYRRVCKHVLSAVVKDAARLSRYACTAHVSDVELVYVQCMIVYTCIVQPQPCRPLSIPVVYASIQDSSTDGSYDYVHIETEGSPVVPHRQVQKPASRHRPPPTTTKRSDEDDIKLYSNPAYFTVSRTSPY